MLQDMRYAARTLVKQPVFTAIAILTLALGIGANTAMFSVINGVLLHPLPYPEPERLVTIRANQSVLDLDDIRAQGRSFEAVGGVTAQPLDFTGGTEPVQILAGLSDADLFKALDIRPALGRLITSKEDSYGAERVVLLTHGFWMRFLSADPNVLGKAITFSGNNYTVIGVLRPDFWMPGRAADVWASVRVVNPQAAQFRGVQFLRPYLRLKAGVTIAQAQAEMATLDASLEQQYPDWNKGRHRPLMPLLEQVVGKSRPALLVLFSAAGCVLLIACVNVANLLLARLASRQREIVIRAALGAGTRRLICQMLTESVLISLLGGAAGLLLARWSVDLMMALTPPNLPRLSEVGIDRPVLAFTLGVSVVTGIVFGLAPALSAARLDFNDRLKETGGHVAGDVGLPVRRLLVVSETALALVLLVGAGLLIKSFWSMKAVDPGFRSDNLLTMRLELPEAGYREIPKQRQFRERLLASLNSLPGVQGAMVSELPMSGESLAHTFVIDGRPPLASGREPEVQTRTVAGDYFRVLSVRFVTGRDFTPHDRDGSPSVVIVNESFVHQYFPTLDPLGARIRWARVTPPEWMTIIGVVGDVKHFGLDQPEEPAVYDLYAQTSEQYKRWMYLLVRSERDPAALGRAVKEQVWAINNALPVTKVRTMQEVMSVDVDAHKFNVTMLSVFAAVALVLAAIGIYGVMAYSVTQRTHEIGIRMALGAQRRDIFRMILEDGGRLVALGTALGLVGALALTRLMTSLLFGVSAHDPLTFTVVAGVLSGVALVASYVPARRALTVDPIVALRDN